MRAHKGPLNLLVLKMRSSIIEIIEYPTEFTSIECTRDIERYFKEVKPVVEMTHIGVVIFTKVLLRHGPAQIFINCESVIERADFGKVHTGYRDVEQVAHSLEEGVVRHIHFLVSQQLAIDIFLHLFVVVVT